MASTHHNTNSLETILTYDKDVQSQWSVVWSTTQIPGMDNATGYGAGQKALGRRRIGLGSMALGSFLTMHCRVTAAALTGGFFLFFVFLIAAVGALANPLRHFEVYLGQWTISGPGRAFRIIPMLDGIGIAICMNAILRAIYCCTIAAIAAIYLVHSVSDDKLPFTYCRDFDLKPYNATLREYNQPHLRASRLPFEESEKGLKKHSVPADSQDREWKNICRLFETTNSLDSDISLRTDNDRVFSLAELNKVHTCNEKYNGTYPNLYNSPAFNFFYVEVVHLRDDYSFSVINKWLMISIVSCWVIIWICMAVEKVTHGRLIWNNIHSWFVIVPWLWSLALMAIVCIQLSQMTLNDMTLAFKVGTKEILNIISDAFEVALYIHSAGVGTELLLGKGLNHYALGHIDPHLNAENVWHSVVMLLLVGIHTCAGTICGHICFGLRPHLYPKYIMQESTLWVFPMFSKCTAHGNYSHIMTTLIFGGLMFSYITVAYTLLKTALHTIFEYRVKLVFVEQLIVAGLLLVCLGLSLLFATNGGLPLLESIDSYIAGVAMPFICLLELVGLLYVYRGHDFASDINVATEDNTCSTRLSTQWQIIPLLTLVAVVIKVISLFSAEMPLTSMLLGLSPLVCVLLSVPLRACHNAYVFLKPAPRHGT